MVFEQIDEKRQDVVANFNGLSVIANREAIRSGDDLLGAIISFRSKDEISTLNAQLTQIKQYVESLRTLRHEHLNWMSTLNGLLNRREADEEPEDDVLMQKAAGLAGGVRFGPDGNEVIPASPDVADMTEDDVMLMTVSEGIAGGVRYG